jgi:MEKHLA domain
MIAVAWAGLTW